MRRRLAFFIVIVLAAAVAVAAIRTWRVTSRQPAPATATDAPAPAVDLAATLSEALQYKTISSEPGVPGAPSAPDAEETARAFEGFHAFLQHTFPRTFATADVQRIAQHSLLMRLGPAPAPTTASAPMTPAPTAPAASAPTTPAPTAHLLYAHIDVVPASPEGWRADPFAGARDGDVIVGRGATDDKSSVIAILTGVESLLASGWTPARTIYLAFGHDEEAGGTQGAAAIAQHLRDSGVRLESLLDEGGAVVDKGIPGLAGRPIAAVAIAEKGYLNIEMCTTAAPGHSSTPPQTTAIGALAEAIRRLEQHPPPRSLNALVRNTLTFAAAEMTPLYRTLMANLWLTGPLIKSQIEKDNVARAQLGTSQAVTMVSGGVKANVLPERACAIVNYRLFPGDTADAVQQRIVGQLNDLNVTLAAAASVPPPRPSDLESPAGQRLGSIIRRIFPDAVVVPVVSPGATDSRHFSGLADQIFRFLPVHLSPDDLASMHGLNERITTRSLARAYEFYVAYLRETGRGDGAQ